MPSPTSMTRPTWAAVMSGVKPSRFFWSAAAMSAVLMVSSAIFVGSFVVGACGSERGLELLRGGSSTEPSITVSPTWATRPPSTVGSMITFSSTFLPVLASRAAARRCFWSSVRSTAERTSATSLLPSAALSFTSSSMIAGRSRERPVPTTIDTSAVVVGSARPPRRSSTICWRRLTGSGGVGEGRAQVVVALEQAGEAEQLVLDLGQAALGARDREQGLGVGVRAVVGHERASRPG